ncbi:hypothetical protein GCM10023156_18470 [Novipirellula rosea]|uniref:Uncharacterized protein n=1 Tax=Novipirellula rosea TaxID=1031540 RepID=A0ABP8MM09_9BACT|tara:strand:- start:1542 stop:1679 length:138 start_codon:yes stop_codon:yes gene_type:complete
MILPDKCAADFAATWDPSGTAALGNRFEGVGEEAIELIMAGVTMR